MDDLAFLRERIESYADYTKDVDRQRTDQQVRAYAGEALSRVVERLRPAGRIADDAMRVLLRCEFVDQRMARAFDADPMSDTEIGALHRADRALVELADGADSTPADDLAGYIYAIDAALGARVRIVEGAEPPTLPAPPAQ
jgi:hypothetical protein